MLLTCPQVVVEDRDIMIANSGWQTEPGYVPPQDVAVDRGAGCVRQGGSLFFAILWSEGGEKWCRDEDE